MPFPESWTGGYRSERKGKRVRAEVMNSPVLVTGDNSGAVIEIYDN